jgi:hypothetical protein
LVQKCNSEQLVRGLIKGGAYSIEMGRRFFKKRDWMEKRGTTYDLPSKQRSIQ